MEVLPTEATLGAYVRGVNLADLGEPTWKEIEEAFHSYGVLVFPRQALDDAAHVAFSKRFGPQERLSTNRDSELFVLSNVDETGEIIDAKGATALMLEGNRFWHTDSSFKAVPAKASLLLARVVPHEGGETEFAGMRAAWDSLDVETRARLECCEAVHDYRYSQGLVGGLDFLNEEEWAALPPVVHPVVREHPATRRESLYIGRHASHIVGEDVAESRALLGQLLADACRPPRVFRHRWRAGDLILWDNRCVLHRGEPWPVDHPRVMQRATVAGDGEND